MNPLRRKSSIVSRQSRGSFYSSPRDVDFQMFLYSDRLEHPAWWTRERFVSAFLALPEVTAWNCFVCLIALIAIIWVAVGHMFPYYHYLDNIYNVVYAIHVLALVYREIVVQEKKHIKFMTMLGFLIDVITYFHYALSTSRHQDMKLMCYYVRLHRPLGYLWALNDYNLKGSVLGTTLKYTYIFLLLRVTWALAWLHIDVFEQTYLEQEGRRALNVVERAREAVEPFGDHTASFFLSGVYLVNKMFIPIGPSIAPANDVERIACLLVMLTGCLVVTGAAVASLSLVISLYMRPEEAFRARYRLIMKEMKESHVPASLLEKVETFYKMYWHKQRAVSATQLLPIFPPTLPAIIYADIYFEATQKSRILRDLTYQFLSEISKEMTTVHYIPGDAIIKRCSKKSAIIYITYGDIEMLTAEDDSTAILRMTRGTVLSPCGGCVETGCGRAHVQIRAATFCTAHVLNAHDLWKVALKHGKNSDQAESILASFYEHFERVKRHFMQKTREPIKYLSSILQFKRNLMILKEAKDENGNLLIGRTDVFLEISGCYIMRNRADASLTDEADAICLRPTFPCILQPTSSLQVAWNSLVACIILAVCIIHPYYLVFMKTVPLEFRFFDYVVTAIYTLDLIVHLSTGANVEEGVPITFSQTSSQQMRSHWFVLDVVATLPIFEFVGDGHFAGINKLLRLPKMFRVLKSMEDECVYQSNIIRTFSYSLLLIIACYHIAAMQQGFMCFEFEYCLVTNFTQSPFWEHKPLDEETLRNRVTFSLYWAISMITFTSHMETWGIENWNNMLYTMFVLEICVVLHIFIEAVYSATIMVTTALREDYDSCIASVKNFLIKNQVDPQLRQRFITYLQLCWYTDKAYSMTTKKSSIFYDLPPHVYQDIVARQRCKYILCIPFMKFLHQEDLKNISSKARLFYTSPNEILVNTGDISNEMYVMKQGICEILSPDTKSVVGTLTVKNHFGVLECLLRLPAYYTVRAVTHVQVFSISRKYLLKAIEIPQLKDAIEFAKEQPEYTRLQMRRESFTAYEPPQPTPNTERFRLPRKHEPDYAFLHPFTRLGVFSVLRYIFPRFTIRPDGWYMIRYEWFRGACAFASAMLFPSYTYLVLQWPWLHAATLLLDLAAYFDILQRMLVGYFNQQGILVYHPSSSAAHYLKGAFIVDLFACLPLESLESARKEQFKDSFRVMQTVQFLMLNRLLQLYRMPSAMLLLPEYIERRDIILVIKAVPLFMALLNVLTCLMVFYSVDIYYMRQDMHWRIVPMNDTGGSWVNLFQSAFRFNMTESPWNMHLASYFWVVYETTTTGYNIFNPTNFDVMQVLFFGMVIGAMITTYYSVRIISIRSNVNKALAAFQEHMRDMVVFMRSEKMDPLLQKEVFDYYEYKWDKMAGVDYRKVLKLCNQITLRTDAILHIYGPTFAKCPILAQCDVSLLRTIGRAVCSVYFLRDMVVIQEDDVISDMYFVDNGTVQVRHDYTDTADSKLTRGSVFGNLDGKPTVRYPVTLVTMTKVHLLRINSQFFHQIIADFPAVRQLMKKYRPDNQNYIIGNLGDTGMSSWKDRNLSSPTIIRKGLLKHLYFKDKLFQIYLIIVSMLCVYADVYNAGFQDNRPALILALYVLDMAFYLKILLQFSLPHIVNEEAVRKVLVPARRVYLEGEFKYDLLSCVPIELLSFASPKHRWMLFAGLRLNRMLRIVTVYKCLKRHHERLNINLILSTMFTVLIWFTLFVHTTACIWYFIGVVEDEFEPGTSWLHNDDGGSNCHSLYVCSLYFVLTTFTQNGVGDIMPKKRSEVIFVSLLQIVSTMVYMVYVGEFSNIIQYQSFRSFSFYCQYLELQEFMKNNRVSKNLVTIVNRYSLHLWRESRGVQVPYLLTSAPPSLKLRVMSAAYMHHLNKHPVFKECEPAFLRQLVGCFLIYTYNEGMYVVKEREITDAMYIIHTGRVKETSETQQTPNRVYNAGEYFGEFQGLTHNTPYQHTYRTLIKSQVLTLPLSAWEFLLKHFPISKNTIYKRKTFEDFHPEEGKDKDRKVTFTGPHRLRRATSDSSDMEHPFDPRHPGHQRPISVEPTDPAERTRAFIPPPGPSQHIADENMSVNESMWPRDSRRSPEGSSESDDIPEPPELKPKTPRRLMDLSSTSEPSQMILPTDNEGRGPRDVEEALKGKPTFLDRVARSAKKLVGKRRSSSASYVPSDDSDEVKDVLLFEEDEETTNALLVKLEQSKDKIKKKSSEISRFIEDQNEKLLLSIDIEAKGDKKADEIEETEQSSQLLDSKTKLDVRRDEIPTSTARLSRKSIRVRYEDEVRPPSTQSLQEVMSTELTSTSIRDLTATERNFRSLDSDMQLAKVSPKKSDESSTESDASQSKKDKKQHKKPKDKKID